MGLNDRIIERSEKYYADEFEKLQAHKSATVGSFWSSMSCIIVAPILAWSLPDELVNLSFLALLPSYVGIFTSNSWLKRSVVRPKIQGFKDLWRWEWALMVGALTAWLAALFSNHEGDAAYAVGGIVGAVSTALALAFLIPIITQKLHDRDQIRLDAELED
ncbi:hypothetical protein WG936_02250 [Corynebacterium sp. H127]|uniref:hypothetical protein n=1 Tax=Corynebacterium sp. H127 TaxID=3133418 RepID=UPI003098A985